MKTVAIIQARMGSTRLPGKVLKTVLEKPLLDYQIERVRRCRTIDEVRVATSTSPLDDELQLYCETRHIPYTRGSEGDVLSRFFDAATDASADIVVRLTADCPVIDAQVIDKVVSEFKKRLPECDYASNCIQRMYPRGMDTEVFTMKALSEAHHSATEQSDREHVTPYIHGRPKIYKLLNVGYSSDEHAHRWTVDTPEDFELVRLLIEDQFPKKGFAFTLEDLLQTLKSHPDWSSLNSHIEQKKPN